MFWSGFAFGCLTIILAEVFGITVYAVKKGERK